mmetsp:Transcript_11990/g.19441  ORF Transcript_11990/g.19441 Transcript_11990/m.19441 type:complete len:262 (+) Transcript_11990:25-810(+)
MRLESLPSCIFSALLVWPNNAVTSAIHSSSRVCNHGGQQSNHQSRAHNAKPSTRRQLSAEDQLDILRLGFIPSSKSSDDETSDEPNNDMTRFLARIRGGGSLDHGSVSRRQLSTSDQLDILRLGFIPSSRSSDQESSDEPDNDMTRFLARFSRGGSRDGSVTRQQLSTADQLATLRRQLSTTDQLDTLRRQLSTPDQLDILRLGFIPSSRSRDDKSSDKPNNCMTRFSRVGSVVDVGNKPHINSTVAPFVAVAPFFANFFR